MTYAQLLTALGAFVIVAFGVSLFVGYAGLDVIGALSDVMHGANTLPAINRMRPGDYVVAYHRRGVQWNRDAGRLRRSATPAGEADARRLHGQSSAVTRQWPRSATLVGRMPAHARCATLRSVQPGSAADGASRRS